MSKLRSIGQIFRQDDHAKDGVETEAIPHLGWLIIRDMFTHGRVALFILIVIFF